MVMPRASLADVILSALERRMDAQREIATRAVPQSPESAAGSPVMHTTTTATATRIPLAYQILARDLIEEARQAGTQWLESGKVYLASIPSVDLADPECTAVLNELRLMGAVRFARADLVAAMDPELVAASEWTLADGAATFHFLVLPR